MAEMRLDPWVWPKVAQLVHCLCDEIELSGFPVCYCTVLPGASIAMDYCGECDDGTCGMGWVRVNAIFASSNFPNPDAAPTCASPLAAEIEVGIARCISVGTDDGRPPTMEQQTQATVIQMADMMTLHRALQCCFGDDTDVVLASYAPFGPEGGCVGGTWGATVAVT